jgi:hypothetical protein
MGIFAPHFNQLAGNFAPIKKGCSDPVWDQDAREDLAWTIAQAEELIARELSFWPSPKFITNEQTAFSLPGVRSDWRFAEVQSEYSQVVGFGTETLTLLQADATVTYTDDDNDPFGRKELATIGDGIYNYLPACGETCEVAVFFRVADGAEDATDSRWEIKPLKVDIDGSNMTITGESSMFVKPQLWKLTKQDADRPGSVDGTGWIYNADTANFVTAVDVYCRTINTQTPITLKWDGWCNCTSPCAHETQLGCAYVTDARRGYYVPRPATWNGTANIDATPLRARPPESIMINYRAGYPLTNCRMNPNLERAIVKLTNALLPEPPCGFCDAAQNRWNMDRKDIDPLTPEAASLPWDVYKQGALEAWRITKMFMRGRGGKLGRGHR